MPFDETQPSETSRRTGSDPLAETIKHFPGAERNQTEKLVNSQQNQTPKSSAAPGGGKPRKPRKLLRLLLAVIAFFGGLIVLAVVVGGTGFYTGQSVYENQATIDMGVYLVSQYQLAVEDYNAGNYQLAQDRLVYIVTKDSSFSSAVELLLQVQVMMGMTATPIPSTATITLTPTPDMRPAEEQYNTAVTLITQRAWDLALDTLSNLRKVHPDYRIVDVDGLMYLALRNRGVEKILSGELEGGIYDFTLAEKFGPLDNEANNYWGWARLYLLGNAFWGAYPEQAAYYYGQLVGIGVDIRDSSGVSAFYRYWASLVQMGDMSAAEEDWCLASEQYQVALNSLASNDVMPTATFAYEMCLALTPSATPTFLPTETPTMTPTYIPEDTTAPEDSTPTETPTPSYTPEETGGSGDPGTGEGDTNTGSETNTETPTYPPTTAETEGDVP